MPGIPWGRPDWKSRGLLDTAVVSLRYDSGAFGTADASLALDAPASLRLTRPASRAKKGARRAAAKLPLQADVLK